jgi:hypothetical protein
MYRLSRTGGPNGKTFINIYTQSNFLRKKIKYILLNKPHKVNKIFWNMNPFLDAIFHNLSFINE